MRYQIDLMTQTEEKWLSFIPYAISDGSNDSKSRKVASKSKSLDFWSKIGDTYLPFLRTQISKMKNFQGNVLGLCETPIEILRLNMKTEPCKSTLPEICQFMKIGLIWPKFDLKLLIKFFWDTWRTWCQYKSCRYCYYPSKYAIWDRSDLKKLRKCQKTENFDKKVLIKKNGIFCAKSGYVIFKPLYPSNFVPKI